MQSTLAAPRKLYQNASSKLGRISRGLTALLTLLVLSVPAFAAAPTWCESGFLDSNQNPPVCFDYYEPADQYCSPTNCFYGYQLSDCDNLPGGNTWLTCIGSTPPSVQWGEFADFSDINADVAIMAALVIGFALVVLGANKARVFVKKA